MQRFGCKLEMEQSGRCVGCCCRVHPEPALRCSSAVLLCCTTPTGRPSESPAHARVLPARVTHPISVCTRAATVLADWPGCLGWLSGWLGWPGCLGWLAGLDCLAGWPCWLADLYGAAFLSFSYALCCFLCSVSRHVFRCIDQLLIVCYLKSEVTDV